MSFFYRRGKGVYKPGTTIFLFFSKRVDIFVIDLLIVRDVVLEREERLDAPVFILEVWVFRFFYFVYLIYLDSLNWTSLVVYLKNYFYFSNGLFAVFENLEEVNKVLVVLWGVDGFDETLELITLEDCSSFSYFYTCALRSDIVFISSSFYWK